MASAVREALTIPKKLIPVEVIIDLRRRLAGFAPRSHDRRLVLAEAAHLYGISEKTLYRALAERSRPKALRRSDRGAPRILSRDQMERYCELIAAIKVRTSNKKGRHLSTAESIRLIETFGIETPDGLIQAPAGTLNKTTVNRYLRLWGYDRSTLSRQPAAVRFQAEHSKKFLAFVESLEPANDNAASPYSVTLNIDIKFTRSKAKDVLGVQVTNNPNAPEVRLTEQQTRDRFPWDYDRLTEECRKRYKDFKAVKKYHVVRKQLLKDKRFGEIRFLDPGNPKSAKKPFFNPNILQELDRHFTKK